MTSVLSDAVEDEWSQEIRDFQLTFSFKDWLNPSIKIFGNFLQKRVKKRGNDDTLKTAVVLVRECPHYFLGFKLFEHLIALKIFFHFTSIWKNKSLLSELSKNMLDKKPLLLSVNSTANKTFYPLHLPPPTPLLLGPESVHSEEELHG